MSQSSQSSPLPQRVECGAAREPAVKNAIIAAMFIGFGLWCYVDSREIVWPDNGNINDVLKYALNHWGPYVLIPAGAAVLVWTGLRLRRRLVADEEGIGYAGRPRLAWAQVDSLDARRLQSKGIVVLHAAERRLVLDSYYLRNFRDLVALVERHVPPDKHVLK